nr:MAG TPA: hypothetical protein [Caudoviricetes sp.]
MVQTSLGTMPGLILFTKKARTILIVRAFRLTLGGFVTVL